MSLRLLLVAPLLVLIARAVAAQQPEPDPARVIGKTIEKQLLMEVESRLKSKDLATIAWGGYLAAQHRVADSASAVRRALRDLPRGEHRRYAVQALLDALIVHQQKVTIDDLQGLAVGMNEGAAIVLCGMDPQANRNYLLALYEKHQRKRLSRWLAAGNLLARIKDREFGRRLVDGLSYELTLNVSSPDQPVGFGVGGAFGGKFADGRLTTPLGFPPTVTYTVRVTPKSRDVMFAEGKRPVYYHREVHHERKIGIGHSELIRLRGRQQIRVDWIGAMLNWPLGKLPVEHSDFVVWTDAAAFKKKVAKARAEIVRAHDRVVDKAMEAGWFGEDERADLAAKVAIKLRDNRTDKSVKLPSVE